MRLRVNRAGNGYVSGYTFAISISEARRLGFVAADGERVELEKIIDENNHQLIVRIKPFEPDSTPQP